MCSNEGASALLPYGLKPVADGSAYAAAVAAALNQPAAGLPHAALEHYRLQLYNYAYVDRFRYASHPAFSPYAVASYPHGHHGNPHADSSSAAAAAAFALSAYAKLDPRAYRVQEEPKPQHSYIGLIGMAILSSPDKKLVLSDIYQYILDNYAYFRSRGPGWRNSIRHNLSLNDCFIKAGRSANGKGHYWAIHPANLEDFKKGDFRRRKAQRRVRKHMGLSVPEDEESLSPPPPPVQPQPAHEHPPVTSTTPNTVMGLIQPRKRLFDVESLLAPDPRPGDEFEDDGGGDGGRDSTPATPSSSPIPLTTTTTNTTFRPQPTSLSDEEPLHETPPGRKYSPDTTADLSLHHHHHHHHQQQQQLQQQRVAPSWPAPLVLTSASAWTCRKPEVSSGQSIVNVHPQDSRWHEAVSRLLLRTQNHNSSKLPPLKITDVMN